MPRYKAIRQVHGNTASSPDGMAKQTVGAFGERAVEAELLRHGWIPANINATVKNAREFDISAWKGDRQILVRVKTCNRDINAFQWGGFTPGLEIDFRSLRDVDFSVLVQIGRDRASDHFYIMPTKIVRRYLNEYRTHYIAIAKRNGGQRKDIGHWTLHLSGDGNKPNYGFAAKWAQYLENWQMLE